MVRVPLLVAVLVMGGLGSAWAIYMREDIVDVPVDRIVANLEARVRETPADAELHQALARAHAIAYARGNSTLPLSRPPSAKDPKDQPDERQLASATSAPEVRPDVAADPAARGHLDEALKHYREAVRLSPNSLTAALGYGWT